MTALIWGGLVVLLLVYRQDETGPDTHVLPAYGGIYREGVVGTPLYVNPMFCGFNAIDRDLCRLLFRGLMRFNPQGVPVLDLAQSCTLSADGLVYTFALQPNQRWHDGTLVTAQDAVFTFGDVLQDPDFPGLETMDVAAVKSLDSLTLEFTLDQPFAPFLDLMTIGLLPEHVFGDVPVADLLDFARDQPLPIGTGALQVERAGPAFMRLVPHRFHDDPLPYIEALEYRFHANTADLLAAFAQGELEGLSAGLPQNLEVLPNKSDLQLHASAEPGLIIVLLNHRTERIPALREVQVRQALLHAINREQVLAASPLGWGMVAHSPVSANNWAHKDDVPVYVYDSLKAVQLLEDSDWRDRDGDGFLDRDGQRFSLTLLTSDDDMLVTYAETIAAYWHDVDIEVRVEVQPFGQLLSEQLEPRAFDAALVQISDLQGDPDPFRFWHSSQIQPGQLNYGAWHNPYADELMEKARITLDAEQRRWLYHQFQDVFAAELPALPISYPVYVYGVHERVQNVQVGPLNHSSERFATFADWHVITAPGSGPEDFDSPVQAPEPGACQASGP